MKYIDAEKLIATLERQNVDKKVIEPLIRIIDSLQQEQPEVDYDELDEAAQNIYKTPFGTRAEDFEAGAEWQYQKDRGEFAKLKAKEWMSGYDDAISRFVKIPYTGERWFSTTDGEFIAGALFEEPIPVDVELYYRKEY